MNSSARRIVIGWLVLLFTMQGCGGLSDVGDQQSRTPTAVATAFGYATSDANGDVAINVRSAAQVELSGKDSVESDAPLLSFLWEPQNDAARAAAVTIRTLNTVNVAVPSVLTPTDLIFKLTVRESDGDTDTATATLHVQPALDSDRFLTPVGHAAKMRFVVATAQAVPTGGSFELRLKSRVTYKTRDASTNTVELDIGAPIQGQWASNVGSGGDSATDFRNPVFDIAVPQFNADDVTRKFQQDLPRSSKDLPDPAFVDQTGIEVVATLTAAALQSQTVLYVVDASGAVVSRAENANDGQPTALALSAEQVEALRISGGGLENKQTALSYYAAIDPNNEKTSLRAWLIANCFNPDSANLGAEAHATYTNNFDLGFGRDMYFRTTRSTDCASTSFDVGDAAAVVINYPTLEAAAKKLDPIIAVAMEYKATDVNRSQPGLVTFYAFAPDDITGNFVRVLSANFDGRGEKSVPGSCTACHGGRPLTPTANPLETYSASANVGATFMPWDLESFLYSDSDPAFPNDAANASLRSQFTRALQEPEFKKLNAAVYATYGGGQPFQCHAAFGGPCELVELWYGGAGLPGATFRDRQVAPGWVRGGADDNPTEAEEIYLDVFARHCRACHVQRVQDPTGESDPQFRTHKEFLAESTSVKSLLFTEGAMPAARLTMDRFWTSATTGPSPGERLAQHLGAPTPAAPGPPTACFAPEVGPVWASDNTSRTSIVRNNLVTQSAACSQFALGFRWELVGPQGSGTTPANADTSRTSFSPDQPGNYDLTLHVTGRDGVTQSTATRFAAVPNLLPVAQTLSRGATYNINTLTGTSVNLSVFDAPNSPGDEQSTAAFSNPVNLTFVPGANGVVTVTPTSLSDGSLAYTITDTDGDSAAGTLQLAVDAEGALVANDDLASSVVANAVTPLVINVLANDFTASLPVTVTASPSGTCAGRLNTKATITVNPNGTIRYVPPPALVTDAAYDGPTAASSCTSFDTFTYTIQSGALTSSSGTVRVPVVATKTFSGDVFPIMTSECASCHAVQPSGANWTLGSQSATYLSLRNNTPTPQGDADAGSYIDLLEVNSIGDSSLMLLKPLGGLNHNTVGTVVLNPTDAQIFRTWLAEGGYNN